MQAGQVCGVLDEADPLPVDGRRLRRRYVEDVGDLTQRPVPPEVLLTRQGVAVDEDEVRSDEALHAEVAEVLLEVERHRAPVADEVNDVGHLGARRAYVIGGGRRREHPADESRGIPAGPHLSDGVVTGRTPFLRRRPDRIVRRLARFRCRPHRRRVAVIVAGEKLFGGGLAAVWRGLGRQEDVQERSGKSASGPRLADEPEQRPRNRPVPGQLEGEVQRRHVAQAALQLIVVPPLVARAPVGRSPQQDQRADRDVDNDDSVTSR